MAWWDVPNYFHICSSACHPTFSLRFQSSISARVAVTAVLPYKSTNPTSCSCHIQPKEHTKSDPLPASTVDMPLMSINLSAAAVPSQLATTNDNPSPTSTLEMPSPLISTVTTTQWSCVLTILLCPFRICQLLPITSTFHVHNRFLPGLLPTSQVLHCHCFQLPAIHRVFHCHLFLL